MTLAPNPIQGYSIKARLIADLCNRYPQVESVTLNGLDGDAYFIDLKDGLTRDVGMNVPLAGSLHTLGLGATGLSCNQTNFIPRTVRHYVDCYERGDLAAANQIYADLHRFNRFVEQWPGARWQKMALLLSLESLGSCSVRPEAALRASYGETCRSSRNFRSDARCVWTRSEAMLMLKRLT